MIHAYWVILRLSRDRDQSNAQMREASDIRVPRPRRMIAISPHHIGIDSEIGGRHGRSTTPITSSSGGSAYLGGSSETPSLGSPRSIPSPIPPPKADITGITVLGEGVEVQADGYTYHRMGSGFNRHNNL